MQPRPALAAAVLLTLASLPPPAHAQTGGLYSLTWSNVAGGGTRSTGGLYQLAGTVGQPEAVRSTGGSYALNGGFLPPMLPGPTDVISDPTPRVFAFRAPAPNPSRGGVTFAIELPTPGRVTLEVYGVDGRRVRTMLDGERGVGFHRVTWDGRLDGGTRAAAGVYFARASAPGVASTRRFVLID